tara:strand:- start:640 stop:951 length:312 start_codon:yes stop_codon:yes gene_type:complete
MNKYDKRLIDSRASDICLETRAELDSIVEQWLDRLTNYYNTETADIELKDYLRGEIKLLPSILAAALRVRNKTVRHRLEYEFCVELDRRRECLLSSTFLLYDD